jgi:hypothetical protein
MLRNAHPPPRPRPGAAGPASRARPHPLGPPRAGVVGAGGAPGPRPGAHGRPAAEAALEGLPAEKPLTLLKVIVALGGPGGLPVEQLGDAVWPQAEGDAARRALEVTLHRLRELLGRDDSVLLRGGAGEPRPPALLGRCVRLRAPPRAGGGGPAGRRALPGRGADGSGPRPLPRPLSGGRGRRGVGHGPAGATAGPIPPRAGGAGAALGGGGGVGAGGSSATSGGSRWTSWRRSCTGA